MLNLQLSRKTLAFLMVIVVVGCLIEAKNNELCDRANGCAAYRNAGQGNTIYFGLMLSYPDPLDGPSLAAAFDDGHNISPAVYLAVEQINNRTDLLTDYQVKVIRLDGGCTVTGRTAVGLNKLGCSCEPIVGIIGPSCGASALAVGHFTSHEQFSMVTIHYGEKSILGDRSLFPFAFAMLGSNFITIQAFTDLIVRNNWTRIVLLHSEDDIDLAEVSVGIENNIKAISGYSVTYISPIYDKFIPLKEIRESYARVIITLASPESTLRALCLAYHEGMIFPKYQWVFKERFDYDFSKTDFEYSGIHYSCTDANVNDSVFGSINLVWSAVSAENNRTHTDIGLTSTEYELEYEKQRLKYVKEYNVNSTTTEWARGFYDAAWSLAFALNSSLEEIDMNLTHILPGSKLLAHTIGKHMTDNVNFQGITGRINFDNATGANIAGEINVYQFREEKSISLLGFFTSGKLIFLNDSQPHFIKSTFNEKSVQVSIAIAIPFLIITVATIIVTIPIQVMNIVYRDHKTIKATSPNLNHIIFIGCYLTVFGNVLLIKTEAWQHTNDPSKSRLCNIIPWCLSVGTSMIIGTVCIKTWRLHRIYTSSEKVIRLSPKLLRDPVLGGVVGVFAAIDILICLIWISIDPLTSQTGITVEEFTGEDLPTLCITVTCQSKWTMHWSIMIIGYKCVITGCSFTLAIFTRIKKKEFSTINIIILSYLFAIALGLGVPMYTIVSLIDVGVSIRFIILCLLINTIVYICLFALFLPSIVPLVKEKVYHRGDPQHTTYTCNGTLFGGKSALGGVSQCPLAAHSVYQSRSQYYEWTSYKYKSHSLIK